MSMHEFEDLVEMSVQSLDQAGEHSSEDLRDLFYNLYQFQASWDTSFTHFRVIDTLLEHKFVYQFEISQHPDYAEHETFFNGISDFSFINLKPQEEWHEQSNPTAGYIKPPYLFFDAGSPLWQQFVEQGDLIGSDALPPKTIDTVDMVKEVIFSAKSQDDHELISLWYTALGLHVGLFSSEEEQISIKESSSISNIRDIVLETNALEIDAGYGFLAQPTPDLVEEDAFLTWWFQVGE